MLAKIFACQPAAPGTAQLMVRLRGEQAILSDLTFILCNNEQDYLQPDGRWGAAQHWFTVAGGYALAGGSGFRLGPTILDPLLANASQVQIQVKLASGEVRNTTLQLARDELFSSEARGQTGNYSSSSVLPTPEPVSPPVAAPVAPPVVQPAPTAAVSAADKPKGKSTPSRVPLIGIIAGAVLALLLIAAGLWWFLGRDTATPAAADAQQEATSAAAVPPASATTEPSSAPAAGAEKTAETTAASTCTVANLNSQKELDFVQGCVEQKLDSEALLTIIQAAKEAKKCGVAQRLYANRAQGGDSKIAIAYAREYDPESHQPGECFKTADKDTAAYWYETALQAEPDNKQVKQRLEELEK
ncbi:hypothetical protein WH279_01800 [Erwinia sp. MYb375]|uniref:hypothetical protein n=1 Tax=unclassified Erwinia TaxID=2622719 RepID=UPI0030B75903